MLSYLLVVLVAFPDISAKARGTCFISSVATHRAAFFINTPIQVAYVNY